MRNHIYLPILSTIFTIILAFSAQAQELDYGDYQVGFKVIHLIDSMRPEFNESNNEEVNRYRHIYIHLWYPARNVQADGRMTTEDYILSAGLYEDTDSSDNQLHATGRIYDIKNNINKWYSDVDTSLWQTLLRKKHMASFEAEANNESYPLIIGQLRPFANFITNEYLASHGFAVAMVRHNLYDGFSYKNASIMSRTYINAVQDMQYAIYHLRKSGIADHRSVGALGFSGSGFAQVHLAMNNPDIDAIADIESGFFMEGLYDGLSSLSSFDKSRLQIPFLHIFSKKLSEEEVHLDTFRQMAGADRYRLVLNKPQHHWDFASEGYLSAKYLKNRDDVRHDVENSFIAYNSYLKLFFLAHLRHDDKAKIELSQPDSQDNDLIRWEVIPATCKTFTMDAFHGLVEYLGIERAVEVSIQDYCINSKSFDTMPLQTLLRHTAKSNGIDKSIHLARLISFIDPQDKQTRAALDNLGHELMAIGEYDKAKYVFEANLNLFPNDYFVHYSLGDLYLRMDDKVSALVYFNSGYRLLDSNEDIGILDAHIQAFKSKIDEASRDNNK